MYTLHKNPEILVSAEVAQEQVQWARRRLSDASAGLTFDPEEHRYFLGGRELRSVSSIVEHFAPFDSVAVARKCSANPKHPLFGQSPEEIIAQWNLKRDNAAEAGTKVHAFAEACCSFLLGEEDKIEPELRERITEEGLVAVEPKEIAAALWWAETDWTRYAVVAKETRIVNPELGYAGTFDLLLYDIHKRTYPVRDYKTNEDLYKWYGDKLLPPLDFMRSNDIGKYTLQQTSYTIQLRNIGIPVDSNELVWLKEEQYENVALEMRYDRAISYAIRQLNK